MSSPSAEQHTETEIIIKPNQGWLSIDWKGVRDYSDLLFLLVRRDFVAKFQQTILGPLWFIINPLVTTLVFTLVFGKIVGIATDGVHPTLFYLCGLLGWSYFSTVLGSTSDTFTGNAHLFGKVYFPRVIVPFAVAVSSLISFAIQVATFIVLYIWLKYTGAADTANLAPNRTLWLFPLYVIHIGILGLGVGMILASLTATYRDFKHLAGLLVGLWIYVTPIIYPLSTLNAKLESWLPPWLHWVGLLNPMTMVTEAIRYSFMGAGTFDLKYYLISLGMSILIFFIGLFLFQRTSRSFVDTV